MKAIRGLLAAIALAAVPALAYAQLNPPTPPSGCPAGNCMNQSASNASLPAAASNLGFGGTFSIIAYTNGVDVGNGVNDAGPAIRAAVAAACNASANSGYGSYAQVLFPTPSVTYLVNSLDSSGLGGIVVGNGTTHCGVLFQGVAGNAIGDYRGGVNVKLGAVLNRPLLYQRREAGTVIVRDVRFDGNGSSQTGWSGGPGGGLGTVASEDASFTLATNASSSAGINVLNIASASSQVDVGQGVSGTNIPSNCTVSAVNATTVTVGTSACNFTGGGISNGATITFGNPPALESSIIFEGASTIAAGYNYNYYLGSGRGGGYISPNVWINYSGQSTSDAAVYLNGYDYEIYSPQIGPNTGIGLLCNEGAQYHIFGGAIFENNVGEVDNSACVGIAHSLTHYDSNVADGVQLNGGTSSAYRVFDGVVINAGGNSSGTYADVLATNDIGSVFTAPTFGEGTGTPQYNVNISGTSYVQVMSPTVTTVGSSGFTNNATKIGAATNGQLVVGGALNQALGQETVISGVQFNGTIWSNGTNIFASILGSSSANDGGLLKLASGGVTEVQLQGTSSSTNNFIAGGLKIGATATPSYTLDVAGTGGFSGNLTAAALLAGTATKRDSLTLQSATQFDGFDFYNGTNDVAKLICSASGCDTGVLALLTGGTTTVNISANAPGIDNNSLTLGGVSGTGTQAFYAGAGTFSGSLVLGSPTGGSQGNGTINTTGCYVNGVACTTGAQGSGSTHHISFTPGTLTAITNSPFGFTKISKASVINNIIASSLSLTCLTNPTVALLECGASTTCGGSPTTIGSVQVTASGTATPATVSSSAITAGDYIAAEITAGSCTASDISLTAEVQQN